MLLFLFLKSHKMIMQKIYSLIDLYSNYGGFNETVLIAQ